MESDIPLSDTQENCKLRPVVIIPDWYEIEEDEWERQTVGNEVFRKHVHDNNTEEIGDANRNSKREGLSVIALQSVTSASNRGEVTCEYLFQGICERERKENTLPFL